MSNILDAKLGLNDHKVVVMLDQKYWETESEEDEGLFEVPSALCDWFVSLGIAVAFTRWIGLGEAAGVSALQK